MGGFVGDARSPGLDGEEQVPQNPGMAVKKAVRIGLLIASLAAWTAALCGYQNLVGWHVAVTLVLWPLFPVAWWRVKNPLWPAGGAWALFAAMLAWVAVLRPSNDREWVVEFSRQPRIEIEGDSVIVHDLRDFRWAADGGVKPGWKVRTYDLGKLSELELMVEPFKDSDLMAHAMVGFGFGDDGRLVVSVEARREEGERYGLVRGCFRQFELFYVFGDERDCLSLRAVQRKTRLYAFPVKVTPECVRALFLDLVASANDLHEKPRFYRSISVNCTTAMVKHVDKKFQTDIGLRFKTLFPGQTGKLLHEMGYMATDLAYEKAKERFRLDERIREHVGDPEFSRVIRCY